MKVKIFKNTRQITILNGVNVKPTPYPQQAEEDYRVVRR
jgi:hypothetical protein